MQYMKENLAHIVREARMGLGLSQEKLAEILGFDSRTILNIEAGRGNPKFDNLCSLITYLNLSANDIFYPDSAGEKPIIQKLSMLLNGCSEQEAEMLIPAVRYLLSLIRQQDNHN